MLPLSATTTKLVTLPPKLERRARPERTVVLKCSEKEKHATPKYESEKKRQRRDSVALPSKRAPATTTRSKSQPGRLIILAATLEESSAKQYLNWIVWRKVEGGMNWWMLV